MSQTFAQVNVRSPNINGDEVLFFFSPQIRILRHPSL